MPEYSTRGFLFFDKSDERIAMNVSLLIAIARLRAFSSRRKWWRRWARRAAVAIVLRESRDGIEVLMIERAHRDSDPWSGHMAFPGGMVDAGDSNSLAAARRETLEEIGLDLGANSRLVARLSDIASQGHHRFKPMTITPYVFELHGEPALTLNHEVAAVVWVPLRFLADRANRQQMHWRGLRLPCYLWQQRRIWGLSLMMLDELLHRIAIDSTH